MSRRFLIGAWLALVMAPLPAAATPFAVEARKPLPIGILVPSGAAGPVASTEITSRLDELLRQNTDFRVLPLDAEALRTARLTAASPTLEMARIAETALAGAGAEFVVLLTYAPSSREQAQLSARVLSLPKVVELAEKVEKEGEGWESKLEVELLEGAVPEGLDQAALLKRVDVHSSADIQAYLKELVEQGMRSMLDKSGHWHPFGSVVLEAPVKGFEVSVDGERLGVSDGARIEIDQLRGRPYRVRAEHPDYPEYAEDLVIRPGEVSSVTLTRETRALRRARVPRAVTLYGGLAASVTGAALFIAGAAQNNNNPTGCFVANGGTCPSGDPFATPLVPIGYTVFATGATLALGTWLGAEDRVPWWTWIAGAVVAGTSVALTVALGPEESQP